MPSSPNYKRDYTQERKTESKARKKKRSSRNKARQAMIKDGKAKVGDGKDVDHKDGNANNNKKSNLRITSKKKNRSYPRTKKAGKKNRKD